MKEIAEFQKTYDSKATDFERYAFERLTFSEWDKENKKINRKLSNNIGDKEDNIKKADAAKLKTYYRYIYLYSNPKTELSKKEAIISIATTLFCTFGGAYFSSIMNRTAKTLFKKYVFSKLSVDNACVVMFILKASSTFTALFSMLGGFTFGTMGATAIYSLYRNYKYNKAYKEEKEKFKLEKLKKKGQA